MNKCECGSKEPCFDGLTSSCSPCKHPKPVVKMTADMMDELIEIWRHRLRCLDSRDGNCMCANCGHIHSSD